MNDPLSICFKKQYDVGDILLSDTQVHIDQITEFEKYSEDLRPSAKLLMRILVNNYISKTYHDCMQSIGNAFESPIEELFFMALIIKIIEDEDITIKIVHEYAPISPWVTDSDSIIFIYPQYEFGEYRVDFYLEMHEDVPDFENEVKLKNGDKIPGTKTDKRKLIVECDGHDFHEKTKMQAQKDKKRDRILQSLGFPVFHFTGSEIWKDSLNCANQVLDQLRKWN